MMMERLLVVARLKIFQHKQTCSTSDTNIILYIYRKTFQQLDVAKTSLSYQLNAINFKHYSLCRMAADLKTHSHDVEYLAA